MQKNEQISALILAGGRGSRMGHVDKGLQPFRGTTMVAARARTAGAAGGQRSPSTPTRTWHAYAAFGVPVWPDETTGFAGPLAGLEAGLRHCATPYLVTRAVRLAVPAGRPGRAPVRRTAVARRRRRAGGDAGSAACASSRTRCSASSKPACCRCCRSYLPTAGARWMAGTPT